MTPLALLALAGICCAPGAVVAQDAPPGGFEQRRAGPDDEMAVYENRIISEVFVRPAEVEGEETDLSPEARQEALNNIRSRPGTVFDADAVRSDLQRLNRLGSFGAVEVY